LDSHREIINRLFSNEKNAKGFKVKIYKREKNARHKLLQLEEIDEDPIDGVEGRTYPELDYDWISGLWIVSYYDNYN